MERQGEVLSRDYDRTADADLSGDHGLYPEEEQKGAEYGMPVSILQPPEAVWGYETVTKCYDEKPGESWDRITERLQELFPDSEENEIIRVIGRRPAV